MTELYHWFSGSMAGIACFLNRNGDRALSGTPKRRVISAQKITEHVCERTDQESGAPKCRVAEAETEMEDLLQRADEALLPVYFPALLEDGLRQSDIQERVLRVSAKFSRSDPETLRRFFDGEGGTFGERLSCFLILIGPELPDIPNGA